MITALSTRSRRTARALCILRDHEIESPAQFARLMRPEVQELIRIRHIGWGHPRRHRRVWDSGGHLAHLCRAGLARWRDYTFPPGALRRRCELTEVGAALLATYEQAERTTRASGRIIESAVA